MFNKLQSVLASRSASLAMALVLFVGLTAPFVILQGTRAFATSPPAQCTQGNYNGCTELSATPPEDLQSVPPNIVLMLDDSGSMAWDYMPDWNYLADNGADGVRNAGVNSLYYNPNTIYTPPPKADSTVTAPDLFSNSPSLTNAYFNGFKNSAGGMSDVTSYGSSAGHVTYYYTWLPTTILDYYGYPTSVCPGGYTQDPNNPNNCLPPLPPNPTPRVYSCYAGGSFNSTTNICTIVDTTGEAPVSSTYAAAYVCPSGYPNFDNSTLLCSANQPPPVGPSLQCLSGGGYYAGQYDNKCVNREYVHPFTYATGAPGQYTEHYVAQGTQCNNLYYSWQQANCVNEGDLTGTSAPVVLVAGVNTLTVGRNVANWFSYYRTRMLMAKTGLMNAFIKVDPHYRFGFASINANGTIPAGASSSSTPYAFNDVMSNGSGGSSTNKLAAVQPFGDGTSNTQKAAFWTWLTNISQGGETPLRMALNAVGQYYQTAGPWKTLPGDPGYTTNSHTQFTCRSSYAILTTDGFWNGDAPGTPTGVAGAASTAGPTNPVPVGNVTQYTAKPPFSGGLVAGGTSLADVATYYWETDLNTDLANEVSASKSDPASWQHMTTFTIGLGFTPVGIAPAGTTVPQIFGWANGGAVINNFSWPTPASNSLYNIADLAHAAVNGHGDFFNVTNPTSLADAFSKALADIGARNVPPRPVGVNASVLTVGAAVFSTGYTTSDWSGQFLSLALTNNGNVGRQLWEADNNLNALYHSPSGYGNRSVFTNAYDSVTHTLSTFQLNAGSSGSLDSVETTGLQTPALAVGNANDTLDNRISYLLGDNTFEGAPYRTRTSILGAIIHSDPVYVSGAGANYLDEWPGTLPPELASGAQTYAAFEAAEATRVGMAYVGANDGMLHAFYAPVPNCTGAVDSDGICSGAYTYQTLPGSASPGDEAWAFVPRAVYANLGNLTNNSSFQFRPTVDSTPVTRDVFFSGGGTYNNQWRTILTGGMGLGGRGVYALDITDPSTTFSASNVLWEFDSDMTVASGCASIQGNAADSIGCRGSDLGYTVGQPNVSRLANGKWVVLVPNGYFPDCTTPDAPTATAADCEAVAAQAPVDSSGNPYSALFVLDAQTGKMIAELKTPVISGVTSFGLARPVMGDYQGDQVDDVAFAGDVQGNLWRFDVSDPNPSNWTVSLVYQGLSAGGHQGVQPITTMPRLFFDPATNRFLVLFGTGKYLGVSDNTDTTEQAIYAVRDTVGSTYSAAGTSYTQADLTQQYLHESTVATGQPNAGATLRCVTGAASDTCTATATPINEVSGSGGGWFINLYTATGANQTDAGERIVVNPGAVFANNTVVFESLITGAQGSNACDPSTLGAYMAFDAMTGGPGGMASLGGWPMAGGIIESAKTSGSVSIVSGVGGVSGYSPGATLQTGPASGSTAPPPAASTVGPPLGPGLPNWRRRSWQVLIHDQ